MKNMSTSEMIQFYNDSVGAIEKALKKMDSFLSDPNSKYLIQQLKKEDPNFIEKFKQLKGKYNEILKEAKPHTQ